MIKAIIFDYDGVIVDSFQNVHAAYRAVCKALGKHCPPTVAGFRRLYGYNYLEAYRRLGIRPEEYSEADRLFRREILKQRPKLYPGIKGVLARLSRRYTLALVTANHRQAARRVLAAHGLAPHFAFVVGQVKHAVPVRKAAAFSAAVTRLGLRKNQVLVVGDRDVDADRARQAGIRNIILVDYGWGHTKRVRHPCVRRPADLIRAVRALDTQGI